MALGVPSRRHYFDALDGVLCEPAVGARPRRLGDAYDWEGVSA